MKAARELQPDGTDAAEGPFGSPPNTPSWYAVWVMSNAEFTVEDACWNQRIEAFLPTWNDVTQWSDRKKIIRRPLFPGYLFVRCRRDARIALSRIAGVLEVLPTSLKPEALDPDEIENIRRALASGLPMNPCAYAAGETVEIDSGPLAGVKGVVVRTKNGTRVIVKIEMLQRAVAIELDSDDLMRVAA